MILTSNEKPFHLPLEAGQVGRYCILPGAPERVEKIAALLDDPVFIGSNREFTAWNGRLEGETVTVCSTGIGGPSTAIAVEELADLGAKVMIRVGTCGGIALPVESGDAVIASGAVRQDGTSHEYAPAAYPAVPDARVLSALIEAAEDEGGRYHVGVVQSKDSFYGQHDPRRMPVADRLAEQWQAWRRLGVLASEMEASTLFVVGASRGLQTGAVFHVIWNQERAAEYGDTRQTHDTGRAIGLAIEAIRNLIRRQKS